MRNNLSRKSGRGPLSVGFFVFGLVFFSVSLAAQNPQDVTTQAKPTTKDTLHIRVPVRPSGRAAGSTIRLRIAATNHRGSAATEQETEFHFKGTNGTVAGLNATREGKTFIFERVQAGDAGLSCAMDAVKECDSVSLKDGGKLTACGCPSPEPTTQTKEHILLAKQVGVPTMKESSQPATSLAASADSPPTSYSFALSDKSLLRATSGGETCWLNRKLQMSICY